MISIRRREEKKSKTQVSNGDQNRNKVAHASLLLNDMGPPAERLASTQVARPNELRSV